VLARYSGPSERFFVPDIVETAPVRLAHRSQAHLARYLINYVGNDPSYHEGAPSPLPLRARTSLLFVWVCLCGRAHAVVAVFSTGTNLLLLLPCLCGVCWMVSAETRCAESRNCQTFTADLFGFLTGKRDVRPYHQFNRLLYKPRHWQFLYEPKSADGQVADGDGRR